MTKKLFVHYVQGKKVKKKTKTIQKYTSKLGHQKNTVLMNFFKYPHE